MAAAILGKTEDTRTFSIHYIQSLSISPRCCDVDLVGIGPAGGDNCVRSYSTGDQSTVKTRLESIGRRVTSLPSAFMM